MSNRIMHWLRQKVRAGGLGNPPYECYWRDRAIEAERELKRTQALLRLAMKRTVHHGN